MEEGTIVRIALPQADGRNKVRPAVVLKKVGPFEDWLLCAISSKLHNKVDGVDILLDATHPDFAQTRLKYSSLIRVGQLFTMPDSRIEGKIGTVSNVLYRQIIDNLVRFIQKQ